MMQDMWFSQLHFLIANSVRGKEVCKCLLQPLLGVINDLRLT